ncbi:MAG TPA: nickel-dependent hydrogenase large subunit, partial [Aliarcobacter cryaerophilus]|nr:nickel-dependent hydrogenase large subunit [Aliarcobacter cryaerophilus]
NPARIAEFKQLLKRGRKFIKEAYLPDVYMAGTMYGEEALNGTGGGLGNYMSYGGFNLDDLPFYKSKKLFPAGIVKNKDLSKVYEVDEAKITEDVTHAWYKGNTNLHPFNGVTEPNYTGFGKKENNIAYLDTQNKYSWIKSPLYNDERMEVGPLARMVVGFASNDELIKKYVTNFLTNANLPATVLFSTVGRTAARAIESELMADVMMDWVDELALNAANGDLSTWTEFDFNTVAKDAKGIGLEEAPRGALGHWVKIKDGKVVNYQTVVPSTWNAAPRDYKGRMGAYEAALIGTKVANVEQPLEILRTIHSFDPCIACAVHLIDTNGKELGVYKVNPI